MYTLITSPAHYRRRKPQVSSANYNDTTHHTMAGVQYTNIRRGVRLGWAISSVSGLFRGDAPASHGPAIIPYIGNAAELCRFPVIYSDRFHCFAFRLRCTRIGGGMGVGLRMLGKPLKRALLNHPS